MNVAESPPLVTGDAQYMLRNVSEDDATPWLTFRNPTEQKAYEEFRQRDISIIILSCFSFVTTLGFVVLSVLLMLFGEQPVETYNFMVTSRVIRALSVVPGWILIFQLWQLEKQEKSWLFKYLPSSAVLGNALILCHCFAMGVMLISRSIEGECPVNKSFTTYNCNPEHEVRALPQDTAIISIISLSVLQIIVKSHHWWAMFSGWLFIEVGLVAAIGVSGATVSTLLPLATLGYLVVLYQYEKNVLRIYLTMNNLADTIRQSVEARSAHTLADRQARELRHLIGNVAHDLKTPMQSFVVDLEQVDTFLKRTSALISIDPISPIQAIRDGITSSIEAIQNLADTCNFMHISINRALDYSKTSAGVQLKPTLETINSIMVVKWALNLIKTKHSRVEILLNPYSSDVCWHIITDKQWLIENIICLVSNAAKFTLSGSVTVTCSLSKSSTNKTFVHVDVEDTGIGISPEMRRSLFQPFQQAMSMAGGTGLGLYSLSKRVEAIGGTYGVADRYDGANGTRFWFTLPYNPDNDAALRSPETSGALTLRYDTFHRTGYRETILESSAIDSSANRPTVLIVDDNENICSSVKNMLHFDGFAVDIACNGSAALDLMTTRNYALVLMDLQMPVMDGLEATLRYRQHAAKHNLSPLIIFGMSAYGSDEFKDRALQVGMNAFLRKPFTSKDFTSLCSSWNIYRPLHDAINASEASVNDAAISGIALVDVTKRNGNMDSTTSIDDIEAGITHHQDSKSAVPMVPPKPIRVLLTDDSMTIRRSVKRTLEGLNCIVDLAENGVEALEYLKTNCYDFVLMDLQMEIMDGITCVKLWRQYEEENHDILMHYQPILGMSGYSNDDVARSVMEAGMDGFIEKPFKIQTLFDKCRQCGIRTSSDTAI